MFAVLATALPAALAVGIAVRKPVPASASLTGILGEPAQFTNVWRSNLFSKTKVQVALVRERTGDGRFAFELSGPKEFAKPDLLVYWGAEKAAASDTIPDDAILLGSFSGSSPLRVPPGASQSGGALILYSLADHEVVDVSKPISF